MDPRQEKQKVGLGQGFGQENNGAFRDYQGLGRRTQEPV